MSDETMPGSQISTPYYAYDFSLPVADRNIEAHHSMVIQGMEFQFSTVKIS